MHGNGWRLAKLYLAVERLYLADLSRDLSVLAEVAISLGMSRPMSQAHEVVIRRSSALLAAYLVVRVSTPSSQ